MIWEETTFFMRDVLKHEARIWTTCENLDIWELYEKENVRGVITMNEEFETRYLCNSVQDWQDAGVEQLCLHTVDFTGVPTLENLQKGVSFIMEHREKGSSVYVHCKAGRSRSATMVAAYLIHLYHWTPKEASELIASIRPHIIIRQGQFKVLQTYYQQTCVPEGA
ncbi:phosphatidylglycerophosphatase and protein-tyrosine phosphatase 1 isoform X2 [Protopterus annectens]|uniref:phosphatidylglycerophosphatase and protein-tyrosine phosphatase 1 isoform X2 n=1 Tax=Protopterus annectens TaxID=7888 RepID=UPI001CFC10D7|nr:phosphatidylglycerophosphatase and protein-tyrosine phosphatase 1 isoform X2 [Protopterus annectens]